MRRHALTLTLTLLAALAVTGCASAASAGGSAHGSYLGPGASVAVGRAPTATPKPTPTPTPKATPAPRPTPKPSKEAWTRAPTALLKAAGDTDDVDAHVGANFPLTLTDVRAAIGKASWYQVTWSTSGRRSTSWVSASAVTQQKPSGLPSASFDALDPTLAAYLAGLGSHVGVEVYDLTRGITFGYNETQAFTVASSIKVPIMCAFFDMLERQGREPTATELTLLQTMIENSNNDSATTLYAAIGDAPGLSAYMSKIGVTGLTPLSKTWGWSTNTASGMVQILTLLQEGRILTKEHRDLALSYMEHVETDQQVGVEATAPSGSTVAMKVGWVNQPNGLWAMNSHGIVSYRGETWIISVFTGDGSTLQQGFDRVNHICETIADDLTGTE